jgi:hypothetical protein
MRRFATLACLLVLAVPTAASASAGQTVSFEAPRDFLDASRRDRSFDEVAGMGVRAIRVILYWKDVAPEPKSSTPPSFEETDPNAYDWSKYDPAIDAAKSRGMKVLLTVTGPVPRWATLSRRNQYLRPSAERYARFMQAVGAHYAGRVDVYSIWNEPNHPDFLRPQFFRGKPASGIWYRKLFLAGQKGLQRAGQGDVTLLMAETAPVGTSNVVAPLVFLNTMLCIDKRSLRTHKACKKIDADGYAHHPYTRRQGPFYTPAGRNDVTIGALSRLSRALDRAARLKKIRRYMPLYLTEFGIQSVPDPIYGVSQRKQAEYQAISERIAWENPRVKWFSQYLLRDSIPLKKGPKFARYPGFESGLRFHNGKRKLAWKSFPVPLSAQKRGSRVSLWGYARGATGRTRVAIYVRGKRYRNIRTDSRGYFRKTVPYVAKRSYRLKWAGHFGPSIRVYPKP